MSTTERPNILWVCTDQQRFDTVAALGNPAVRTPNLDRLVAQGTAFSHAYCQNPICTPSRASFMTGRYPSAVGVTTNGNDFFPSREEDTLVSRLLAEAGYDCGLVGKLHIAGCSERAEPRVNDGFRVFDWSHSPRPLWDQRDHAYARWLADKGLDPAEVLRLRDTRKDRAIVPTAEQDNVPPEHHHLTWAAERAEQFVRSARSPWLLCMNIFEPHPPFNPPYEYFKRYRPDDLPGPLFRESDLQHQLRLEKHGVEFQTSPRNPAEFGGRELQAAYFALVEFVDAQVGRVLRSLEDTGQFENTLIVFMSDHGEMLGDHGLVQKGCRFYDSLVRVPLVVAWPGRVAENRQLDALVELTDLAPTLLELAGLAVPERMQGRSFAPLLDGSEPGGAVHREAVRCEYLASLGPESHSRATMYRDRQWKLVQYHTSGIGELYNMNDDPGEFVDLWDDPACREIRDALIRRSFDAFMSTVDTGVSPTRPY